MLKGQGGYLFCMPHEVSLGTRMKVFHNHKATTGVCKKSFIDTKESREDNYLEFLRKDVYI